MTNVKPGKKFAIIAALCYAVTVLYNIITRISFVDSVVGVHFIISWVIIIALAVALFLRSKKSVVVAAGANILCYLYYLINYFSVWHLFDFLAYAILVVVIVLAIKGSAAISKMWFLAGATLLLGNMIGWFQFNYFSRLSGTWEAILFAVVEAAALILCGLWLKNDTSTIASAPVNEPLVSCPNGNGETPTPEIIGGADKLLLYKDLLDSGAITQEEFDQKRKQILGQ